jgi:DNA-binding HxlR family transcriptional regulator
VGQDEGGSLKRKGPPRDERPAGSDRGHPAQDIQWDKAQSIIQTVGGRWDITILRHMASGITRPADLLAAVNERPEGPGLSGKVMYETLRRLQDAGLVSRAEKSQWPKEVHYSLTAHGHESLTAVSKLGTRNPWGIPVDTDPPAADIDTTIASPARVWNYLIGGKDNYAVDRVAGGAVLAAMPSLAVSARLSRQFQADAVRMLVQRGVRQFIDIGTGLPVTGSVHEIAQRLVPESRVVYVDNDPIVLAHARALLTSSPEGTCSYIHADLREPGKILAYASQTLDLTQPVAVFLIAVLHFIGDQEEPDPWEITSRLLGGISGDAYLVIGHGSDDIDHEAAASAGHRYNELSSARIWLRSRPAVMRFFDSLEMLGPGLVPIAQWRPQPDGGSSPDDEMAGYVGIGRRPART